MNKIVTVFLIFTAVIVGIGALGLDNAYAACEDSLTATYITKGGAGQPAVASVTNHATNCSALATFSSYKVYVQPRQTGWLKTQTLFDTKNITLSAGETKQISVNTANCMTQSDVYKGQGLTHFDNDTDGGAVILGDFSGDANLCSTCTDECSVVGQRKCLSGLNGYVECKKIGECLKWDSSVPCSNNQTCNNGSCVDTCTNQCTLGQFECSGSSSRTCNTASSSCTSWSTYQTCDSRCYRCGDGRCDCGETKSSCSQDCGHINICTDSLSGSPTSSEQQECASAGGQILCGNGWCKCNCAQTPTVNLAVNGSGNCNNNATLTWTSSNATSCYANGSWSGNKATSGSESIGNFIGSRTYSLTCTNSSYSASDSVTLDASDDTLEVNAGSDKTVDAGESIRLDGSVNGNYNSASWSCTSGSLSNSTTLKPTYNASSYDNYDYNYNNNTERTYTCTLTVYNDCGSDSDSMRVTVEGRNTSNFQVALTSRPDSGCAPLNGVDLTAKLSNYGSYSGNRDFTYYFDCQNDGSWEKTYSTSDTEYTAYDLCNYSNNGNYTARVRVDLDGHSVYDTEVIQTNDCDGNQQYGSVTITKMVRNLSKNTAFGGSITASPLDTVTYKIIATGTTGSSNNILIRDSMPSSITNIRDLQIDGMANNGSLQSGINIGSLSQGQTKVITYTGTVANQNGFSYGQNTINNIATVTVGSSSANSNAIVYVYRSAVMGATTVSTGFENPAIFPIIITILVLAIVWVYRKRITNIIVKR